MALLTNPMMQQSLATTSAGGALVSWFASTLPVVQWLAAGVAIVTGVIFLYGKFRKK